MTTETRPQYLEPVEVYAVRWEAVLALVEYLGEFVDDYDYKAVAEDALTWYAGPLSTDDDDDLPARAGWAWHADIDAIMERHRVA